MRSSSRVRRSVLTLLLPAALVAACQRQSPNVNGAATGHPSALAAATPAAAEGSSATPAPFATPPLLNGTPDIAALVAKVKPSVVNITTIHDVHPAKLDENFPFGPFGQHPLLPFGPGRRGENPV